MDIENQFFTEVLEKSTLFLRAWGKKIARCVFVRTNFFEIFRSKTFLPFFKRVKTSELSSFFSIEIKNSENPVFFFS
ncbi:hypothetical protein SAMN05421785_1287 [Chryseobacterium gambrini]|uniref:Uncharacterized protein n=1 Tax=Chryseobacterium gambrini TaxID=373672 RepID=A0A1N7QZS0_9FLAO|nr:hypothetical protein SAMN05421785_1287 [Chryseobacterium gambrini]